MPALDRIPPGTLCEIYDVPTCKNPATKLRYGLKVCDFHATTWWDRVLGLPKKGDDRASS